MRGADAHGQAIPTHRFELATPLYPTRQIATDLRARGRTAHEGANVLHEGVRREEHLQAGWSDPVVVSSNNTTRGASLTPTRLPRPVFGGAVGTW